MSLRIGKKSCAVCTAPARNQNYGVLTCEACKSFFRRARQGDSYKSFHCVNGFDCVVDIDFRKSCGFCRFQRCLSTGMDMRKSKSSRAKPQQQLVTKKNAAGIDDHLEEAARELLQELRTLTSPSVPVPEDKSKFFSMMEIFDLDILSSKYAQSFYNIHISEELLVDPEKSLDKSFEIISAIGRRLLFFANSIEQFAELGDQDRTRLFQASCSELCMINAVLTFDRHGGTWCQPIHFGSQFYKNVPAIDSGAIQQVLGQQLHEEKVKLTCTVQDFHPDEIIIMLLYAILLFTPSRAGIVNVKAVQRSQIRFAQLLKKYLLWRFGEAQGRQVFSGLTSTLKEFHRIGRSVFERIHGPILGHPRNKLIQLS